MLTRRYSPHMDRLMAICDLFDRERRALHPTEVGKALGMHFMTASKHLERCDELFMKLPRSADGVVRYHLTPTVRGMDPAARRAHVNRIALGERLFAYASLFAGLSVLVLGIIAIVIWVY